MTDNTRPDPKVQVQAIFEIGRVMVEQGLPAVDIEVHADGSVRLCAFSCKNTGPQSWDDLIETVQPWMDALGLRRDEYPDKPRSCADGWRRGLSAWGRFAGLVVTLHGSVLVGTPVEAVAS